ncbi:unnamed protein product, partial [Owenia fusiformis]
VPDAPESPAVSDVFHDNCTITWQPPLSDGGAPIIGYQLERKTGTSQRWVKANKDLIPELTFKAEDLIEGNQYEFRVAAENKAGLGPYSSPSQPITAKDPW